MCVFICYLGRSCSKQRHFPCSNPLHFRSCSFPFLTLPESPFSGWRAGLISNKPSLFTMAEATRSVSHYKVVLVGNSGVGKSCLGKPYWLPGGQLPSTSGFPQFFALQKISSRKTSKPQLAVSLNCRAPHTTAHLLPWLAAFWTKAITLEDRTVKLELWDTAGQGMNITMYTAAHMCIGDVCFRALPRIGAHVLPRSRRCRCSLQCDQLCKWGFTARRVLAPSTGLALSAII